jgi:glycosyltransferase involved in cell wall biosynthesis
MKEILFIIPSLSGGGAERVLLNILKYLDREKFKPYLVLFARKGQYLSQLPEDVEVYDLKKKSRFHFFKLIFLLARKLYPQIKPDLVVSFLEYTNLLALIARNFSQVKPAVVISERNYASLALQKKRVKGLRFWLAKKLYPRADKILTVSNRVGEDLTKNYRIGRQKMQTVYNSVDLRYVDRLAKEIYTPEIDKNFLTIVACGRLTQQKNYPLLLQSFAKIYWQINAKLLLLGQGEQRYSLEQLSNKLGLQGRVKFLGFKDNPYKYLAGSDLFVLSSSWEGFPNVILEAMACGVPVISTRCPSGPDEIITDGVDGRLVSVGDVDAMAEAMLKLLKDEPLRKRLADAGRKRAENFRVEKMVAEYEKVFDEVVEQNDHKKE